MAEIEAARNAGVRWTPATLPSEAELREAIDLLTVKPVTSRHAAQCIARLTLAFEAGRSKLTDEENFQRARVWREANGDLGDELWSEATLWCLRHHRFGMPRPAEFRAAVSDKHVERQRRLDGCRRLLAHVEKAGPRTPEDEEREVRERENELLRTGPPDVQRRIRAGRVRELIDIFTRHGMHDRAAANQAQLDEIEREQRAAGEIPGEIQ